jgi:DNA modification methylase
MASSLNKTLRIEDYASEAVALLPLNLNFVLHSGIFQGEVLDTLKQLAGSNFDLIVADPPYNLGKDFGNDSDRMSVKNLEAWTMNWVGQLSSVASTTASLYICSHWKTSSLIESAIQNSGWHVMNRITWKREKGRGAQKNWKQNMEDIWFAVRDREHYTFNIDAVKVQKKVIAPYRQNGKPKDWIETPDGKRVRMTYPSNIWTDLTVPFWSMAENTEHPTQKPEKLIERLILASSNAGDNVLDLFSGSGTTSVVAHRLGRKFIGIELNPDFVRLGLARLKREGFA